MSDKNNNKNNDKNSNNDIKSLIELNKNIYKELKEQGKTIEELKREQNKIIESSEKMGKHIDFINKTYDNIKNSYFIKGLFKS